MPWSKNNYPDSMKNLSETVRKDAIKIGNSLLEKNMDEGKVIRIAISKAKEKHDKK